MSTELNVTMSSDAIGLGMGVRADFDVDLVKCDAEGNPIATRRALTKCPNLITNYGMDILTGTTFGSAWINVFSNTLHVGMGNAAPTYTDLALANKRAAIGNGGSGNDTYAWDTANGNPRTFVMTRVYQFGVGAASGAITELGLSPSTTGQTTTRALFKDAFGDPTTVNVAADEQLVVTYRIYLVPNETVSTLIKTVNGTEYTLQMTWASLGSSYYTSFLDYVNVPFTYFYSNAVTYGLNCYAYSGVTSGLGPVTGVPLGTQSSNYYQNNCTVITTAHVTGNYYIESAITLGLNAANLTNIGAFYFQGNPLHHQIGISPRINKTSNDTIKFTARFTFTRL